MSPLREDTRIAYYAGSWYSGDPEILRQQLSKWIEDAEAQENTRTEGAKEQQGPIRAIIGPHAGYMYSGSTAAFGYCKLLQMHSQIKRIFLFGPSHRKSFRGCMLPSVMVNAYDTPFGPIPLDSELISHLESSFPEYFKRLSKSSELHEHSLEMHLPFIYYCTNRKAHPVMLIPIMVGSLPSSLSLKYGQIFAPYFDNADNFFVISSDFCHWGKSFDYTFYRSEDGQEIYKFIENLDRRSFEAIENQNDTEFRNYLDQTKNTICGRYPISILLNTLKYAKNKYNVKFIQYKQSKKCMSNEDTSVSYAVSLVSDCQSRQV
ncbi:protein MEMO1 homolog [Schistocerca gregaria]|uniref:protein MEMO1 homolog n=1 Tax=Schistocerca gregaria TaxID=7010 RepID=UPI00211EDA83|nr:protein MEMO1 homolog [Schistocerca gregaria]